jgi:hypothetical protein
VKRCFALGYFLPVKLLKPLPAGAVAVETVRAASD